MATFNARQNIKLARNLLMKTSPAYVQFYITARCNLACQQCNIIYADGDSNEMNIHQICQMAENFVEIGACMVLLIGGEPFARRDLPEIIEAFVSNDIHVRMQTNGLAPREMLERCVKAGGHDISISLDSLAPAVQDKINGDFEKSWERAIRTVSVVNDIFPENGTAFFGTVLMPDNVEHIPDVLEFATEIGWGVSLVPAHVSTPSHPRGFRTYDDTEACRFTPSMYPRLREALDEFEGLRDDGLSPYDSDEYLDDIYRFLTREPTRWRRRNHDVCDSPQLYFAVQPNGNINPCCDFKLAKPHPVYQRDFPALYRSGQIHREVYEFTRNCDGCMYGSYPEITITARFLKSLISRFVFFSLQTKNLLKKYSEREMLEIARDIHARGDHRRALREETADSLPAQQ